MPYDKKQFEVTYICSECNNSCPKTCEECTTPLCVTCGLKETLCHRFYCTQCFTTDIVCQADDIPHIHGYPLNENQKIICTCPSCAKFSQWGVGDQWRKNKEGKATCPVSNIVNDLLKRKDRSQALELFDGGCGCAPSCGPAVGVLIFIGADKQKHDNIWKFGFNCALKKWMKRFKY